MKKEKRESPLWLTVYSDFVTNMVLFFLVLYTSARTSREKQQEMFEKIGATVEDTRDSAVLIEQEAGRKIEEMIQHQDLEEFAMVSVDETTIRVVLREAITFDSGDDRLVPESFPVLDEIVEIIKDIPNDVVIEGHTDNVPITVGRRFFSNWELSGARAISVLDYLKDQGIEPDRLSAVGYGEYRPVFSNETPRGRSMNRRVEINIVRI